MKTFRLALRMMLRDLRAGELHLLGLAIVIAVASLTSVGFLADRVSRGLDREANQLLGGDLLLRADRPWQVEVRDEAQRRGLSLADTVLFTSMVSTEEVAELAGIKVVSDTYPLRGTVRIADGPNQPERQAGAMPARDEVWLDERLFAALGVSKGDKVGLGLLEFTVSGMITFEPDRGSNFFSLLPRAIFNERALADTGLLVEGSRATWRLHLAGTPDAVEGFARWAGTHLERGQAVETIDNARPQVRNALDQAQRFLRLAALLAVVLAAVAVGLSARRFMRRHLDACAVMRCLGAGQAQVVQVFVGEFVLFGLVAALIGGGLGWGVQQALAMVLVGVVQAELPAPSWLPWLHGVAVGMALLVGFVLPQLLRLGQVPTVRVLRRELGTVEAASGTAWLLGAFALFGLIFWIAADVRLGLMVAAGFALALGVFALAAWGVLLGLGRVKQHGSIRGGWRYGVASLRRRMGASVIQASALGLGLAALLLLTLVRSDLLDNWRQMTPEDAPNRFIINIQPDQRAPLAAFFVEQGLDAPDIQPMIRGRMVAINGQPVDPEAYEEARTRRLAEREFNLSHGSRLPELNRVQQGVWHGEAREPQFSIEAGLADTFGISLGDRVRFNVSGREVEAPVTSVRELDWDSMRVNFFFIASPGLLDSDPASLITSFRLPDGQRGFAAALVNAFPNLTLIDVDAVIAQVRAMTDKLILIVQFVFGFAVLAGLVVLYAALQATHDEREHELAVLRTLGARNVQLRHALLAEFALLGGVAGVLAGAGASVLGWVLASQVFRMPYLPDPAVVLVAVMLGMGGVVAGGWLGTRGLLARTPLSSLRALA
ncbi:MAG: FtsX-like permease family protein [Rhodocyclaceae bacterium]|jgi:putative ABC transport system permease protein|nr:FtsX-like permease family protein [Rhodocyclaceae bacterium]